MRSYTACSKQPIVGELVGSDDARIMIRRVNDGFFRRSYGETLILRRELVSRFERSVRPSQKSFGAGIGFGIGAAIGFAVFCQGEACGGSGGGGGVAMLIFALPAAALGDAVAPGERWAEEDPKDERKVRVGIAPTLGGGKGVRLSLSF